MAQWFRSLAAQAWEAEIESQRHVKVCLEFSRYQHSQNVQGETLLQREKAERNREGGRKGEKRIPGVPLLHLCT